ncbi:MAG: hypothetical protein HFJ52_07635 [Clostridia bacterium]|nr:hypothetical protein [Clostridia bacterium]
MKKIGDYLEKHAKLVLVVLFIIGILVYGALSYKMKVAVYHDVDEELYISMARTFHYDGNFAKNYEVLNYNCVIYSMIISVAYFFYSAKHILFIMRMIGVLLMMSSIFPIYLLSKEVLKDKKKALLITAVSLLIPELTSTLYLIQEVLCYPVFLWIAYLAYLKFTKEKNKIIDIALIILLALIFFIKSYAIVFAGAYFLSLCLIHLKNKDYKGVGKVILQGLACLAIIIIGIVLLRVINGEGVNHYSSQISGIFPLTLEKITAFIYGIFFYAQFFTFCLGFLPVFTATFGLKNHEEKDKNYITFLLLSTILTILEVSAVVFIPEETGKLYPYKFCYRYLAPLAMPYIIMFVKCKKEDIKIDKKVIIAYIIIFAYLIWYYIGQGTKLASIDAGLLFAIQKTSGDLFKTKKFAVAVITAFLVATAAMIALYKKNKIKNIKTAYIALTIIGLIILFPIQSYWHIYQANSNFSGRRLRSDYVKVAEFIKEAYDTGYLDKQKDKIYIVKNFTQKSVMDLRNLYGFLNVDYQLIDISEEVKIDIDGKKALLVVPKDYTTYGVLEISEPVNNGFLRDIEYVDIYEISEGLGEVKEVRIKLKEEI